MAELGHSWFPLVLAGCNSFPFSSSRIVVSFENSITASGGEISNLVELPLRVICAGLTHSAGVCAGSQLEEADKAKLRGSEEL